MRHTALLALSLASCAGVPTSPLLAGGDPLPSWTEGDLKASIIEFVTASADPSSVHFVPEPERIAVFDNDGTLLCEKPRYAQLAFMVDRAMEYVEDDPSLREQEPYRSLIAGELSVENGLDAIVQLAMETHTGMLDEEFVAVAERWLAAARHPDTAAPYTSMVYVPMLELIEFLQAADYTVWICTGGGLDFVRCFSYETYGIAPQNVIGTSTQKEYRMADGKASFLRKAEMVKPLNDGPAKPVNIDRYIGRAPVIAVGNSDGDLAMLEYVAERHARTLTLLLHHDDASREYDYDEGTERALEAADTGEIQVISIARDFLTVFDLAD